MHTYIHTYTYIYIYIYAYPHVITDVTGFASHTNTYKSALDNMTAPCLSMLVHGHVFVYEAHRYVNKQPVRAIAESHVHLGCLCAQLTAWAWTQFKVRRFAFVKPIHAFCQTHLSTEPRCQ